MAIERLTSWIVAKESPVSLLHAARTAVAALVAILVARLLRLPEDYWAAITTLIVMQSTLGAALPISVQRFLGTALGAMVGVLVASYVPGNVFVFAVTVFLIGLLCAALRLDRNAYRFAGVTLTIIMLIGRDQAPRAIAVHRFLEVSVGIVVGLVLTALWPELRAEATQLPARRIN